MFYLIAMCFIVSCCFLKKQLQCAHCLLLFFKKKPCPLYWNTLNPTTILETNLLFCFQMDPSFLREPHLDFKPGSRFLFQTPQHATSQLANNPFACLTQQTLISPRTQATPYPHESSHETENTYSVKIY